MDGEGVRGEAIVVKLEDTAPPSGRTSVSAGSEKEDPMRAWTRWQSWLNVIVGVWVFISPWVLRYTDMSDGADTGRLTPATAPPRSQQHADEDVRRSSWNWLLAGCDPVADPPPGRRPLLHPRWGGHLAAWPSGVVRRGGMDGQVRRMVRFRPAALSRARNVSVIGLANGRENG
jgi:hypothetical protein